MSRLLFALFCLLQAYALATDNGFYTVISPGTIHPNSAYNVIVSVQHATETCHFKLGIEGPNFTQHQQVEVAPMSAKTVEFAIPDISHGGYSLTVEGTSGLIFQNSTSLNFGDELKPHVYVQTDKATYKPGDLIQFRVVFLDESLRPAEIRHPLVIFIKDADANRIKQFSNVTLNKGVFSGKLQLSEFPPLGKWMLEVQLNGAIVERKPITVDKYVLPKFEVTIDAPKKAAFSSEKLGLTVRSKYTFGKWVKGKAYITIKSFMPVYTPLPHPPIYRGRPIGPVVGSHWGRMPERKELTVEKTVDSFNGKTFVEFELKTLLPDSLAFVPNLDIFAEVEEELTGNKHNATAQINLVPNRFQMDAPSMQVDCKDKAHTFNYTLTVTNLDDEPVSDDKHAVTFKYSTESFYASKTHSFEAFLNANGMASVPLNCAEHSKIYFDIEYREQHTTGSVTSIEDSSTSGPGLFVKTASPTLHKPIEVQLNAEQPLTYFIYTIVARGNVIESDFIELPSAAEKHTFYLKPSFEMIPEAKLYVHYIENGNLKFYETSYKIQKQFRNTISIDAPLQTKPGETIELQINTDPNSFVGLMGVDQSVLLLKSGNDFDGKKILDDIKGLQTSTPSHYLDTTSPYPGKLSGVVTLTNAHYPHMRRIYDYDDFQIADRFVNFRTRLVYDPIPGMNMIPHSYASAAGMMGPLALPSVISPPPPPRIRKQFLENWFFDDFESTNQGLLTVKKQVPDTITSWIVTAFTLNSDSGLALTQNPTKIQTFRPFFIATNLPYSVKRGETVSIPVIVFNYMDRDLVAEVTLDNQDAEYEFIDSLTEQAKRTKSVKVPANNGETTTFTIRPKELGEITLKITAISPLAGDAMHKKLKVEPEGVTVYKNRDFYLFAEAGGDGFKHTQSLDIPNDVVPDSEHIEVSVMGDILGTTISNLDQLVRMPSGCGEQNMINFVPNILVLRYLESIQQLSPGIEDKAKRYMEIGYQRELTYKHDDGSYSAFGKSDKSGSTWLTAYVMRSFHQAAKYIDIDTKVLNEGLDFLASKQAPNGSFPEYGVVLDFSHHNEIGLTAFVLLAFLENSEQLDKHKDVIKRGFDYLQEHVQDTDDLYALSIAIYTLQLRKLPVVEQLWPKLDAQAHVDGGNKWWTKAATHGRSDQAWRPMSHDVEITGYFLMTLLDRNEPILPITKWLISQRNSNGGFASTQETVVGLQALIKFAEKAGVSNKNLQVEVKAPGKVGELHVNSENSLVVQTLQLQKQVREIELNVKGTGSAILQISYRYNELKGEDKQNFKLTTNVKSDGKSAKLEMEICAEFVPLEGDATEETNMVVMEVALPSGYAAVPETFDKIKEVQSVKRVETKKADTNVVIYFDSLQKSNEKCLPVIAERLHEVAGQKPVPVVIYDYYDSQKRATEFYQISSDLCSICADEECKQSCKK